jgi:hypothetical protein
LFLHECFSDFIFCFVCDGWQNQATCLQQFLCEAGKSATETLEMLHEAFGEHSLCWQWFLNGIHVSRPAECQLKLTNDQGDQAPAKNRKC